MVLIGRRDCLTAQRHDMGNTLRQDMGNTFKFISPVLRGHVKDTFARGAAVGVCEVGFEGPTKHVAVMSEVQICFKPRALFPEINHDIVEPNDYAAWEELLVALVRHYRERSANIRYWEVANEPDLGEDGGCPYRFHLS